MTKLYLFITEGDVDPCLKGPYRSQKTRDAAARRHRKGDPEMKDGIFKLNISEKFVEAAAYAGGFFPDPSNE